MAFLGTVKPQPVRSSCQGRFRVADPRPFACPAGHPVASFPPCRKAPIGGAANGEGEDYGTEATLTGSLASRTPQWDHGASIAICNKEHGVLAVIQPLNDANDEATAERTDYDCANGHLMASAPELLEALDYLLQQTIDQDLNYGISLTEGEEDARRKVLAAIAKARATTPIPPDPECMNDNRAAWAGRAITAFQKATGTDDEDSLGDLLAGLLHWCDRNNYDFETALDRARFHYEEETSDPESRNNSIVIEVRAGVVQEVRNLPTGYLYEIIDHDDRKEAADA